MTKADLARQIIEQFPHASKRMLGKMLYQKHPLMFEDEDRARYAIRGVTGTAGGARTKPTHKDIHKGPLSIPRGELNDYSHYVVKGKRVGILADIHIPYHDYDALSVAIEELRRRNIDTLILNGDIIDCYAGSDFVKEPDAITIKGEIEILCHFIEDLQKIFPSVKIIYKLANHEERWERYILKKAPVLYGFECFELPNLIKIEFMRLIGRPLDIDFVVNKRIIDVGKLAVVHAHEFGESVFSPVNASRGFYLKAKANVVGAHLHQTSEHTESDINGKIIGAWSIGCLCDLHPKYRPLNRWNHGACFVEVEADDNFSVDNFKIINGKAL